jgi:hypothetical protein
MSMVEKLFIKCLYIFYIYCQIFVVQFALQFFFILYIPMTQFSFHITASDGSARTGTLQTPHGTLQTPVFMPVGTAATIK